MHINFFSKGDFVMKKIFTAFIVLLLFSVCLTSCGLTMPRPEVKEGEFDVSVTYEVGGETKTLALVYVCEYDGVKMTLEGTRYRNWNGHFEGYKDGDVIDIFEADDGSRIVLSLLIYAEYFMGDPDYVDFYPEAKTERIYFEDGIEMIDYDEERITENYGVRIIDINYDEPIENTFD